MRFHFFILGRKAVVWPESQETTGWDVKIFDEKLQKEPRRKSVSSLPLTPGGFCNAKVSRGPFDRKTSFCSQGIQIAGKEHGQRLSFCIFYFPHDRSAQEKDANPKFMLWPVKDKNRYLNYNYNNELRIETIASTNSSRAVNRDYW